MLRKTWMILPIALIAASASALDLGAHIGYFDNNVKKAYIGADLMLPFGVIAVDPNIDYTKIGGAGLWWGNIDALYRFQQRNGPQFWAGAGPTYYYVTGASGTGSSGGYNHGGVFEAATNSTTIKKWGYDVTGGIGFSGTFRPYITARYNKIKQYKAGGIAVGLRFGH